MVLSGEFAFNLSQSDLKKFTIDEEIFLAFIAAASKVLLVTPVLNFLKVCLANDFFMLLAFLLVQPPKKCMVNG